MGSRIVVSDQRESFFFVKYRVSREGRGGGLE